MVACVDLIDTGRRLDECGFDDPRPTTAPMVEGIYLVTLYEVATRRKIAEAEMKGDSRCPLVVLLMVDRTTYSEVSGGQLYEVLRKHVP